MIIEGSNGDIELKENSIKITRKGIANILTQGLQGEKTLPISSITAIQFKDAGRWMAGYIQFSTVGSVDRRGGSLEATKDENAVLFEKSQQDGFEKLRTILEARILAPKPPSDRNSSPIDELERLANLVERGFLTREEFDRKKAELLSK